MSETISEEPQEQSQIKAARNAEDFFAQAKVIISVQKRFGRRDRLSFLDLCAGPGRCRERSMSTPVMILERALKEPAT